ncbi:SURF1 family protein [Microvirga pudoricolor]|uniref:SURF1 family protein n=1 Tax=Microvirga pudoricolor TaxID=2778729 RepID=UPI0019503C32|nr:SURF1 family protein [Microvirga pudoricolor]MBM6596534.1 SURF1 family protein [Microvirga pudoricolor]
MALLVVAGLALLAVWQIHRRAYKLDLIERVETRIHAAHVPAPGQEAWDGISATNDEYRRVVATGRWIDGRSVLVQALTELGGGYWVITPLARDDDTIILVNRGFIPASDRDSVAWHPRVDAPVTVKGLLRLSEPGGGVLRANDPSSGRWFSRDVGAIAATQHLSRVAPYFVDAERAPDGGLPIAGLTVVTFPNNHLIYAITWSILALMAAAGTVYVNLDQLRSRKRAAH